jgi:hypothetical protein
MKLSEAQVQAVEEQTGLQPIPEDNPAMQQLKDNFGDHTFYVDERGLYVLETPADDTDQTHATAVQVASWADESCTALQAHEPMATDAVFKLTPGNGEADDMSTNGEADKE